jgi:2'-5' RNA ligase
MRLFIAIEVSEEIKEELTKIQSGIENDLVKAKWVNQNQMHLTLKFLGEVNEERVEIIKEKLSEIKTKPFFVVLDKIGFFPSEDYIRVVWIGLKPINKIVELQKKIDESLKELFPLDKRFHPHITIARVRFVKEKKEFIENINKIEIKKKEFQINKFKLVKSTLTREGPTYEDIEAYSLR